MASVASPLEWGASVLAAKESRNVNTLKEETYPGSQGHLRRETAEDRLPRNINLNSASVRRQMSHVPVPLDLGWGDMVIQPGDATVPMSLCDSMVKPSHLTHAQDPGSLQKGNTVCAKPHP